MDPPFTTLDFSELYGSYGVIVACLTDPLSLFINKIRGCQPNDVNAVGVYYSSKLTGVVVNLFSTYDNEPIPWMKLGISMKKLLESPFVTKIVYYPGTQTGGAIFTPQSTRTIPSGLEARFRTTVIAELEANSRVPCDKELVYTLLWMHSAGITNHEIEELAAKIATGYSVVNHILLTLMGAKEFPNMQYQLAHCHFLGKPLTIRAPLESADERSMQAIINHSEDEIKILNSIFIDLFITNSEFRSSIVNTTPHGGDVSHMRAVFAREMDLVTHLVGSLEAGSFSNSELNEIITQLNRARYRVGEYKTLPISANPAATVQINNDQVAFTFRHTPSINNNDPLKDLGTYIGHIAECFGNPGALIINLGSLVTAYNQIIAGTDLDPISMPRNGKDCTLSRSAVVTAPGNTDGILSAPTEQKSIGIPIYDPDLSHLTDKQLQDVLVYIDSLRDTSGTYDTRFANLQNEIVMELAKRRGKI